MALPSNVGGGDRAFRIILGVVLIAAAILIDMAAIWMILAFLVATIAVVTAFMGYCPINQLFGIDTCGEKVP